MSRILNVITNSLWLSTSESLEQIVSIAKRENDIEVLATKLNKPLDNAQRVTISGNIATINITGPIMRYASIFDDICGATSTENLALDIKKALENPKVKQIVLHVSSPGGQASGISELSELIYTSNKPIIAYVEDMAASGAYWIVSACDHIAVSKTASLGSIGAVYSFRKMEKNAIEIVSSISPKKRPDINSKEGKAQIQTWADDLGEIFVSEVARYRGVSKQKVLDDFGGGDLLIASKAKKAKMCDEITTYEELLKNMS